MHQTNPSWDIEDPGMPTSLVRFTTDEMTWASVGVRPDGREVVFDVLGSLYTAPVEGGVARRILDGAAMHRMPSWAPDGTRLLYLSDADGYDHVWPCQPDGSAPRQLTHETTALPTDPAWGADAHSVLVPVLNASYPAPSSSQIRRYDLPGGPTAPVATTGRAVVDVPASGLAVLEPTLSRDGRHLYYTERTSSPRVQVNALTFNYAIKGLDTSTGETRTVASGFGGALRPTVSPDGSRLAFIRRVGARTVLFCQDLAERRSWPVLDCLDRDLQVAWEFQGNFYPRFDWMPDGREVVIWYGGGLHRVDVESRASRRIPIQLEVARPVVQRVAYDHDIAPDEVTVRTIRHLAPGPDGSIAFTAVNRVWWRDPAGEVRPGPDASPASFDPWRSADGETLLHVGWQDDCGSRLLQTRAGTTTELFASSGVIRQPRLSPDGSQVTFRIQAADLSMGGYHVEPGIYVMSLAERAPRRVADGDWSPGFDPTGDRIWFVREDVAAYGGPVQVLSSVGLDGQDVREHARGADADTSEMTLSPDGRWLAFRCRTQYYVVPFAGYGELLTLDADESSVPVATLTTGGGYSLTWTGDSRRLLWTLGNDLYGIDVDDAFAGKPADHLGTIDLRLPADVPDSCFAFTGGAVITMRGDEVIASGTVLVRGNRIVAVGPVDEVELPDDATVVDTTGKTVMPGLVDGHGHIDSCGGLDCAPLKQPLKYAALAFGVTTNFDPFPNDLTSYEATEHTQVGYAPAPRWIGTGFAVHGRPRMPSRYHMPIQEYADALAIVRRKAAHGGISVKSYKQPFRRQRQMLVRAAREVGLNITVEGETHFYNNISSVLDGHTNLEHNLPVARCYDDVVQLLSRAGVHNTPTLIVAFGELFGENYLYQHSADWRDPRVRQFVNYTISGYSALGTPYDSPPHVRAMATVHLADELYETGVLATSRMVKELDDAGVVVNCGSHGEVPGLAQHWEMQLLAAGGMAPHRVLRTATLNIAESLGIDGQLGSLEAGKLADLLVLDEDPLTDIAHTLSVSRTMVNGRLYDCATMDELTPAGRVPRGRFYWEDDDCGGIDWHQSWGRLEE